MSNNFEVKTKKALFINGERITEYNWDKIELLNQGEVIIATNHDGEFALYSKKDGKFLYETDNYISHEIKDDYIIIKIMHIDLPLYGVISLINGKLVVPIAFTYLNLTKYKNVFEIEMSKLVKGYYLSNNGQIVTGATEVTKPNDVEYDFLIDGEWKRYSFIDGIYTSIN